MALSGTGTLVASLVCKITASTAMVKAGGAVSGTILTVSQGITLLAQTTLGSGAPVLASALGALKAGSILSGGPAYVLAVCPTGAKAAVAMLGGAMTVAAVPPVLGAVGFTGTGIAASSLAAKMMSLSAVANGGGVAAGSLVATLQSVGAAGLSLSSKVLLGSAGSAVVASVMGISQSSSPSLLGEEDMKGKGTGHSLSNLENEADRETEETPPSFSNTESDQLTSGNDLSSWDLQDLLFWVV
ncbi:interferon alpha-inducible protein 27-like protein 2B isoform X2 [Chionomys nivalis]|uniref:interferon alpha-inducible protein 27-like protein 2B isoform X2 n=1 Tax=Chionomys nivalis TaxID=269649 RepID=UPI0025923A88|nr:interferon alpha-inducible protein 27-like protein 2B isoform X2 [Chionomys nivalis]